MGIGEEMFWDMNPARLKPYFRAEEIRKEKENQFAWLQGVYVWEALRSALSGFGKKKVPYLKEPIPFTSTEVEEAERKKMERMKRQFQNFVEGLKGKDKWQTE